MLSTRAHEPNPDNVPSEGVMRFKALFIFLQVFGGQVGMPLFIGTMLFSPNVKRHLSLVNFCGSWTIYSIIYCLTIYHNGDRFTGINSRVCVAQAALVHGAVPLSVLTYCALHVQVWMGVRRAVSQTSWIEKNKRGILIFLFVTPYVAFIAFTVVSLVVCLKHPELVDRTGAYYCTINYDPLVFAVPGFAAGVIAIMIILEIIIGVTLIRRWKVARSSQRLNATSISMIVRILIFSVYGFATLAACAAFLARSLSIWPYLVQASLPTAVFLMFGTRCDIWRAWCFWRRRGPAQNEPLSIRVTLERATDSTMRMSASEQMVNLAEKKKGPESYIGDAGELERGRAEKARQVSPSEDIIVIGRLQDDAV